MKALNGKKKKPQHKIQRQRRGLLAMAHIAKKDLGMLDDDYRDILVNEFGVASSAALSLSELEDLVARFREKGWQPEGRQRSDDERKKKEAWLAALRDRAETLSCQLENGEQRLQGLCKSICGVDKLEWCRDAGKLKRLLAVLGHIAGKEG